MFCVKFWDCGTPNKLALQEINTPQNIPLTWLCAMHFLLVSLPGVSVMTAGISLIFMPGWVVIIPITNLPFPIFQGILH